MSNRPYSTFFPETGFVRLPQIIGNQKANPPIPALIPVSRTTWLEGVKSGEYPPGHKISDRCTAWRAEDIRALIERLGKKSDDGGDEDE